MRLKNFIKYIFSQFKEEFSFYIGKFVSLFLPGKYGRMLREVKKQGYSMMPQYFTEKDIQSMQYELKEILNNQKENGCPVMEVPGSLRLKRMERYSLAIKGMSYNFVWIVVNFLHCFKFVVPTTMYSRTEKCEKEQFTYAAHPHFDFHNYQLKFVVALEDVTEDMGPTEIIPGSSRFYPSLWKLYFDGFEAYNNLNDGKTLVMPDETYLKIKGNRELKQLTMKKGDVLVFDSRNLHRATPLKKGVRELLWFYF